MAGTGVELRVAMRSGKRRALPNAPDGSLVDLIETAKAHIRAKVEHPFRVIKQPFGFQRTRLCSRADSKSVPGSLAGAVSMG
jgi:transposase, IS5 family